MKRPCWFILALGLPATFLQWLFAWIDGVWAPSGDLSPAAFFHPRNEGLYWINDDLGHLGRLIVFPLVLYYAARIYSSLPNAFEGAIYICVNGNRKFRDPEALRVAEAEARAVIDEVFTDLDKGRGRIHLVSITMAAVIELLRISLYQGNGRFDYIDFSTATVGCAGYHAFYTFTLYYVWVLMIVQFWHFRKGFLRLVRDVQDVQVDIPPDQVEGTVKFLQWMRRIILSLVTLVAVSFLISFQNWF